MAWPIGEYMNWIRKAVHVMARRLRPSIIDRIAIKVGVDVDTSGMDALNASTADLHARWTEIGSMIEAGKAVVVPVGSTVTHLDVGADDILVLSVPTAIRPEQRKQLSEHIGALFGAGPRVMVLDGGMSLAHVVRPQAKAEVVQEEETTQLIGRLNGAPIKAMRGGIETAESKSLYREWLKGEGHRPCEHEYEEDSWSGPGVVNCTYCRSWVERVTTAPSTGAI